MPESARVRIPDDLLDVTGGQRLVEVSAGSVGDALAQIEARHPGFAERVLDVSGVRRGLALYLDGVNIRMGDGLATTIEPGALLAILPVAGITPTA